MEKNGSRRMSRALVKESEKKGPSRAQVEMKKKKGKKKKKHGKKTRTNGSRRPTRLEPRAHLPFVDRTRLDVSCASWPCHGRGMGKWGEVICRGSRRVLRRLEPVFEVGGGYGWWW